MSSQSQFYQYLVNVSHVEDCDIQDARAKAMLLEYVKNGTTWNVSARVARASAIRMKWPAVLDAYHAKYAMPPLIHQGTQRWHVLLVCI